MQTALSKKQIFEFIIVLRAHFTFHENIRESDPISKNIQYPKTPQKLSESLILHLIQNDQILTDLKIIECSLGGKVADILAKTHNGPKKIEVKATGTSRFQGFGDKDKNADYLIWVDFYDFFHKSNSTIFDIYVLQEPHKFFTQKDIRLNLKKFSTFPVEIYRYNINTDEISIKK